MSSFDALIIACEEYKGDTYGADWKEFEASYVTGGLAATIRMTSGSTVTRISRTATFSYAGTTVTIAFGGGAYGNTPNNEYVIPVRVLGLKHNA